MELPGRTQGNPGGSLWAADVAHFVQRPKWGMGVVVETEIKESPSQRGLVLTITITVQRLTLFFIK